ncbi:PA2779 family protein [Sulfuricella sp.]|uniref:PA2779 family protein n=1 Tax=Sulfuricella sp. TaxID=2099377 RepID=UPI002CA3413F|nr:PA2779 family protein [Sulfuricella sp.]HUX65117.1 PA2779 family protein [Sulfuricella sp.]
MMNSRFMRMTSRLLIASVLGLGLPLQSAHAGLVGTDKVAVSAQSQSERERIRAFLDREDVRKELQTQGVDVNTAKARVDALTDEEVQKVAGKLDKMPAGGEIIGILFTIFVILLVTDILGFTKVFPFTRSIK